MRHVLKLGELLRLLLRRLKSAEHLINLFSRLGVSTQRNHGLVVFPTNIVIVVFELLRFVVKVILLDLTFARFEQRSEAFLVILVALLHFVGG